MFLRELFVKFGAVHLRHHHIGEENIELSIKLVRHAHRFGSVARGEDVEAVLAENQICEFAENLFILRDQDDWLASSSRGANWRRCGFAMRCTVRGKIDFENRSFADLTDATDLAAMLFDDGIDRREAKAGVFARLCGAEEWFKKMFLIFLGESQAGVRKGQ